MPINKELNEKSLENAYGGPIKTEDLPDKFKTIENEDELTEDGLEGIYGGPIQVEDLPEGFYRSKEDEIKRH